MYLFNVSCTSIWSRTSAFDAYSVLVCGMKNFRLTRVRITSRSYIERIYRGLRTRTYGYTVDASYSVYFFYKLIRAPWVHSKKSSLLSLFVFLFLFFSYYPFSIFIYKVSLSPSLSLSLCSCRSSLEIHTSVAAFNLI